MTNPSPSVPKANVRIPIFRRHSSKYRGKLQAMIQRVRLGALVEERLRQFPVVTILGPRQVGKSTLARQIAAQRKVATFFDLEHGPDIARLAEPTLALGGLRGLVVIDEVQRRPDLFPTLRVLADGGKAKFLVLGSASPELLRQSSESLAGRVNGRDRRIRNR